MKIQTCPTMAVTIFVAGPLEVAKEICARRCFDQGLCVTVTPTEFVYTGGRETGVAVGLINYPRFPTTLEDLQQTTLDLASDLIAGLHQTSASVVLPNETIWLSRREVP